MGRWLIMAALAAGCIEADPTTGTYACQQQSDCLDGFTCASDGYCRATSIADNSSSDGGLSDAGLSDAGLSDGGLPDAGYSDAGSMQTCSGCDAHASCHSGTCVCNSGYTGNGTTCTPKAPACAACDPHAMCVNDLCQCNPGWTGTGTSCVHTSCAGEYEYCLGTSDCCPGEACQSMSCTPAGSCALATQSCMYDADCCGGLHCVGMICG